MKLVPGILVSILLAGLAHAQPTQLSVERDSNAVRLGIKGETGRDYTLEATRVIGASSAWSPLLTFSLTNSPLVWLDSQFATESARFYRLVKFSAAAPLATANDFRLIDHKGSSHELYYQSNDRAVVLIFTGNNCSSLSSLVATIKSLRDQFAPQGVTFWMIDANASDTRSNIAATAATLGIDLPILHDDAQLVAQDLKAAFTSEAVAINTADWTIFYRGAIEDRAAGSSAVITQNYLQSALSNFLANQTVSPSLTPAGGCAIEFAAKPSVSYSADIAPILQSRCVSCHVSDSIAPWSMTNHSVIATHAASIKQEVLAGRMPPWHADPNYGAFANDFSMRPAEAAKLIQWIDEGAPRGSGPDPLTNVPPPPPDWPLGTPDRVVSIPKQSLPATGVLDYRYLSVATTFTNDVWLRGAVVRPGNKRVVHHCLVYFGTSSGFLRGLDGFFAGYVPGYDPVAFPAGTGKFLPKGTVLQFQMHYITTGKAETDQTELGLYVSPAPPQYALQTKSAFNVFFSIPPGEADHEAAAQYTFAKKALLYEMSPHMHLRGSRFKFEAFYPDNSSEVLLNVPHYAFSWQTLYRVAEPKLMPAGTRIQITGAWDNSPQNPDNPDPGQTVYFGEQTFDEMLIGYFNFAEVP